jgi:hypothetical protein
LNTKDHIRDFCSFFQFRKGFLYYVTDDTGFIFRVPVEDTGDATFHNREKSLIMMRYIRKEIEAQNADEALPIDAGTS